MTTFLVKCTNKARSKALSHHITYGNSLAAKLGYSTFALGDYAEDFGVVGLDKCDASMGKRRSYCVKRALSDACWYGKEECYIRVDELSF